MLSRASAISMSAPALPISGLSSSSGSHSLSSLVVPPFVSPESADDLLLLERQKQLTGRGSASARALAAASASASASGGTVAAAVPTSPSPVARSTSDLVASRYGLMLMFNDLDEAKDRFQEAMENYIPPPHYTGDEFLNVLGILLSHPAPLTSPDQQQACIQGFTAFLQSHGQLLRQAAVRRVTLVFSRPQSAPEYYTFRERLDYGEDPIYRHLEPPLAFHLELMMISDLRESIHLSMSRDLCLMYFWC
jgi:hypothetical protein